MAQTGKHALVTGGGSGIGFATARALAAAGWQVTIAGRNKEKLEGAAKAISGAHVETCDVTDADSMRAAVQAAVKAHGAVQLLVNNAGGVTSASFEKTSLESFRQTIDLNLMGTANSIHAALPQMKQSGWGRIVNIASTAGLKGYRYVSAYVAAKHAVVGLTKALALELAKTGITVNAVCPGYTDTDVIASAVKTISQSSGRTESQALATFTAANPQGRLVKPEEVAAAILWLASEGAAAVNGVALPIAGGEVS
ncbi:MAG: SDR family oxidoreductase [Proteobacteria bacterium]|nr:SDR family oxidoreductase [Pseudomonadota bacterium]